MQEGRKKEKKERHTPADQTIVRKVTHRIAASRETSLSALRSHFVPTITIGIFESPALGPEEVWYLSPSMPLGSSPLDRLLSSLARAVKLSIIGERELLARGRWCGCCCFRVPFIIRDEDATRSSSVMGGGKSSSVGGIGRPLTRNICCRRASTSRIEEAWARLNTKINPALP